MKINNLWLLLALVFWALLVLPVNAQTFSSLYSFTNSPDGASPLASLTLSSNVLYGTTYGGGSSGAGTVFKVNSDGTGYTVLKNFQNTNGAHPAASLILSSNLFYGTTEGGGSSGVGTVFKVNTDGTGYTVLKDFTNTPAGAFPYGAFPEASLTLSSNVLYGTTYSGSSSDNKGAVFKVNTDGTGYTVLKMFLGYDGANPAASLTLSSNTLYGTTQSGGGYGYGTVFKVNTDGTGYRVLKSFQNTNGANPAASLTLLSNVLYGTTMNGGNLSGGISGGTVFKVNTDGTGYTVLYNFANTPDGAHPEAGLTLSDDVLYGTTVSGGSFGSGYVGTIFKINTDGTGYTVLKNFKNTDGGYPYASLILSSKVLYGTTKIGGSSGYGTIFSLYVGTNPIVVTQPQNQIAFISNAVSFSVTAKAPPPYGYQWYFTNATFQAAGAYAQILSGFVYGCLVTNGGWGYTTVPQVQFIGGGGTGAAGYAVVSNGLITVITITNAGSGYTSLPVVQIVPPNGLLVNQTNATLNLSAVTTNNVGSYFVVITNAYGSVTSSIASLIIAPVGFNLISGNILSGGKMSLSFVGLQGSNYALDRSFSLSPINWIPQVTNPADANGNLVFTNTPVSTTNNFWRIRSVP